MYKVFVGTLECGENDFDDCVSSISKQIGVAVTHFVVSNMREIDAHNTLWEKWRSVKQGFDIFVKIDADTVLAHENVLLTFAETMNENSRITGMQAPLHDYYTDSLINGLNCFSNAVHFNNSTSELFCDRNVDVHHNIVLKADRVPKGLIPAGYHCHKSSIKQAFHFGLRRALKGQHDTIQKVRSAYSTHNDSVRKAVIAGVESANKFDHRSHCYSDETFLAIFNEYISK